MNIRIVALSFMVLYVAPAESGVYKCVLDGKTTYSQRPCKGQVSEVKIRQAPKEALDPETAKESRDRRQEMLKDSDETNKRIKRRNLNLRINRLIAERDGLAAKRESNLAKLQKKLLRVYDFRQKAVIESEMQGVRDKYWSDKSRKDQKIHDARMELLTCCN